MSFLRAGLLGLSIAMTGVVTPAVSRADTVMVAPDVMAQLWQVIDMPASLAIMREEGQGMAEDIAESYLPPRRGDGWDRTVAQIYDPSEMDRLVQHAFGADFAGTDPAPVLEFFGSELGHRIIGLELSARRAFLDPDTEEAAKERVARGEVPSDRSALIDDFMTVNDLVTFNITGALNTNFAFLSGLAEAEVFKMSEADILAQVYKNAEETRADTEDWLRAYLTVAYQPLSDEELADYVAFSETEAGQRLNRALFAGFGAMYDMQYNALGRAVARQLSAQDL